MIGHFLHVLGVADFVFRVYHENGAALGIRSSKRLIADRCLIKLYMGDGKLVVESDI